MNKVYFILVLLVVLTQPCLAAESISSDNKHHSFGIKYGVGSIRTDLLSERSYNGEFGGVIYGYQYDSNWTINTGLVLGEELDVCIITCIKYDDASLYDKESFRTVDYYSYILNIKGSLPLNNRWTIFGKLGVNHYNSKFSGADRNSVTENGIGTLLAAGIDFRAYNGFGVGLEVIRLDMGEIYAAGLAINLSYLF